MNAPAARQPHAGHEPRILRFPPNFLWGVSTSAYQIEGAVDEDGRGVSIWDTFCHTPGKIFNGENGDVTIDHYHRYLDDIELMKEIGVGAYRFSIAWPRIQPDAETKSRPEGLDFYRRLVDGLLQAGITPLPTLYHWDLPQWLQDAGGWTARDIVGRFVDYTETVYAALGDRVGHWITLNEPWCSAFLGHASGIHAPGTRDGAQSFKAVHHLLLAHGEAIGAMRAAGHPANRLGIALNLYQVDPASSNPSDTAAAQRVDGFHNRLFLDPVLLGRYPSDMLEIMEHAVGDLSFVHDGDVERIASPLDFLGVNYYTRHVVRAGGSDQDATYPGLGPVEFVESDRPKTAMGWPIAPEALTEVLRRLQHDYPPLQLLITENGAAFLDTVDAEGRVDDPQRVHFLDSHIRAVHRAIAEGVDVGGYLLWSLMDNFEWSEGYSKRFGIVHVDYETQRRTIKTSGDWYRQMIIRGGPYADDSPAG